MSMEGYIPPYTITDNSVNLVSAITETLTKITFNYDISTNPRLKKENRISSVFASLTIENNSLTLEQMEAVINGEEIDGMPDEIRGVKNTYKVYGKLLGLNPYSVSDMQLAHRMLMNRLSKKAGIFRSGGIGMSARRQLVHLAPMEHPVMTLMEQLAKWAAKEEVHPLIKSCVVHYEIGYSLPFKNGNGRMGRMWQTLLLYQWNPLFGWLPMETLLMKRRDEYYQVLGECDNIEDSGKFIEFMLRIIYESLDEIAEKAQKSVQVTEQVERLLTCMGEEALSTKELMGLLELKHRPTFRDNYLLPALELGYVEMTVPDKPNSSKQKYRKIEVE